MKTRRRLVRDRKAANRFRRYVKSGAIERDIRTLSVLVTDYMHALRTMERKILRAFQIPEELLVMRGTPRRYRVGQ